MHSGAKVDLKTGKRNIWEKKTPNKMLAMHMAPYRTVFQNVHAYNDLENYT